MSLPGLIKVNAEKLTKTTGMEHEKNIVKELKCQEHPIGGVTDGDFPEAMEMEKLSKDS